MHLKTALTVHMRIRTEPVVMRLWPKRSVIRDPDQSSLSVKICYLMEPVPEAALVETVDVLCLCSRFREGYKWDQLLTLYQPMTAFAIMVFHKQ